MTMSKAFYRRRQRARVLGTVLLGAVLVVGFLALTRPHGAQFLPTLFVLVVVQLMMGSLEVEVAGGAVRVRFGIGWPRFSFPLDEIVSWEAVRNQPWWGWGIRLTPQGWLFNVSGLDAVELGFRNGRRVRIGTDDPAGLSAAIRDALSTNGAESHSTPVTVHGDESREQRPDPPSGH
jgi:hypothetical protein